MLGVRVIFPTAPTSMPYAITGGSNGGLTLANPGEIRWSALKQASNRIHAHRVRRACLETAGFSEREDAFHPVIALAAGLALAASLVCRQPRRPVEPGTREDT